MANELKFTKVQAGWYATEDGTYAVVNDGIGYVTIEERDGSGLLAGVTGDEWGAVHDAQGRLRINSNDGDNIDWFDTKRDAVAACQRAANNT